MFILVLIIVLSQGGSDRIEERFKEDGKEEKKSLGAEKADKPDAPAKEEPKEEAAEEPKAEEAAAEEGEAEEGEAEEGKAEE